MSLFGKPLPDDDRHGDVDNANGVDLDLDVDVDVDGDALKRSATR